ncbi:hypothetical protein QVD17_10520 [Tagetes erecta]|uniref:Uncharacterized protein n=1 Tax=Tagetes erecta TaxID=13708 RepID=A0AAD8P4V2_TARER|nr:hypothetical protein QVD17_10520 [Tagetes erecta]
MHYDAKQSELLLCTYVCFLLPTLLDATPDLYGVKHKLGSTFDHSITLVNSNNIVMRYSQLAQYVKAQSGI